MIETPGRLVLSLKKASQSATGVAVLVSANPIHDTGGGQRSAQMALELLHRDWCVVFVNHGEVTETVDLGLHYPYPGLVRTSLDEFARAVQSGVLDESLVDKQTLFVTQVPVRQCLPLHQWMEGRGASVYDCVDRWDSELGYGWYRTSMERRVARAADVLVASAPMLVDHVGAMTDRPVHLLPNAYNERIFQADGDFERPADLPAGVLAIYVGSLWGKWMDWELVARSARAEPTVEFVFIGDHRGEGGSLPGNCHFLGLKAQTDLPAYLAHASVGFLPWKSNQVTQATSPLKIYEYLAMGLPVVAPELEPLKGLPGVVLEPTLDAFGRAVAGLAHQRIADSDRQAMADFAKDNSWQRRIDSLLTWADHAPVTRRRSRVGRWLNRLGLYA